MKKSCLLAIPVYNEEAHVARVIEAAGRHCDEILVINDGSTDGTADVLQRVDTAHVITHAENQGYGRSLADAFAFARRHGRSWLITMDCDEQHEPAEIPRFVEAIAREDADIISGTRYPDGFDLDSSAPRDRREINRRITAMLNAQLGLTITDAFCGFKAYRVDALRYVDITVPGYAMPLQLWVQAARARLRIRELPVKLIYRDPTRHFGGRLDDPAVRLQHYVAVFEAELARGQAPCCRGAMKTMRCRWH